MCQIPPECIPGSRLHVPLSAISRHPDTETTHTMEHIQYDCLPRDMLACTRATRVSLVFARFNLLASLLFSCSASTTPRFFEIFLWTFENDLGMMSIYRSTDRHCPGEQYSTCCCPKKNSVFFLSLLFVLFCRQNLQAVKESPHRFLHSQSQRGFPKRAVTIASARRAGQEKQQQFTFQRRRPDRRLVCWLVRVFLDCSTVFFCVVCLPIRVPFVECSFSGFRPFHAAILLPV